MEEWSARSACDFILTSVLSPDHFLNMRREIDGYPDIRNFYAFREKQDIGKFRRYRGVPGKPCFPGNAGVSGHSQFPWLPGKMGHSKSRWYQGVPEKHVIQEIRGIRRFGISMQGQTGHSKKQDIPSKTPPLRARILVVEQKIIIK